MPTSRHSRFRSQTLALVSAVRAEGAELCPARNSVAGEGNVALVEWNLLVYWPYARSTCFLVMCNVWMGFFFEGSCFWVDFIF